MEIKLEEKIKSLVPDLKLGVIQCDVVNSVDNNALWEEMKKTEAEVKKKYTIKDLVHIPAITATRKAYKLCGKEPSRYRPSAEQLHRRIIQGKSLYRISTLVDLINLISLRSAYSIGGFDADKIIGNLSYGVGRHSEPYEGIGRGNINIEGMPVLRDELGGIGTPTSDEMRTRISESTTRLLMNINCFDGDNADLEITIKESIELLRRFVDANNFAIAIFS